MGRPLSGGHDSPHSPASHQERFYFNHKFATVGRSTSLGPEQCYGRPRKSWEFPILGFRAHAVGGPLGNKHNPFVLDEVFPGDLGNTTCLDPLKFMRPIRDLQCFRYLHSCHVWRFCFWLVAFHCVWRRSRQELLILFCLNVIALSLLVVIRLAASHETTCLTISTEEFPSALE